MDHFNTNNRNGGAHSDDEYEEDIDRDDDALSFEKSSYYEYTETYQSVSEADDVAPCASQSMKKNVSKYSRIWTFERIINMIKTTSKLAFVMIAKQRIGLFN